MNSHVKSAERVLDIFEALSESPKGMTFTRLQQSLGIPKSSLHALLDVLTHRGYLEVAEVDRVYTLGLRLWERSRAYIRHHGLLDEALPVMHAIVESINETVQLATLDGIENIYLAKVDSSHALRLQSDVGKHLPAYATGLGKALLAGLDEGELNRRFRNQIFHPFTLNTITSLPALQEELTRIRFRGFAIDNQEYTPGIFCVAVPIYGEQGATLAAMSVSVPLTRVTLDLMAEALTRLVAGSRQATQRMGVLETPAPFDVLLDRVVAQKALAALDDGQILR